MLAGRSSAMTSNTADRQKQRYALFLVLVYVLVYLLPLGTRPVIIPDEARYAEIPREMLITGDWVSPHLNGLRYFEKPPLGYWATAVSLELFGGNAFAMRLPSALAAGLSAFAIFLLLRRFGNNKSTALPGAMAYLSMLGVFLIGTINILDSLFSFLLTAAFASFYFAHKEHDAGTRLKWLLLLGAFCGAAFLSKGFLAFVLLGIVIVPFVIWEGRWRELFTRGWIPVLAVLAVVAPWAIMVHLREPEYWQYFIWEEHIKRFASEDAQHSEPFWYYLVFLPLLATPWIFLLPSAFQGIRRSTGDASFTRYVMLWLLLPLLFFSLSRGKLPTYILPCIAPLAILIVLGVYQAVVNGHVRMYRAGAWLGAIVFALFALAIVLIQTGALGKLIWYEDETWKWSGLALAFGIGAVLLWQSSRAEAPVHKLTYYGSSLIALMIAVNYAIPTRTAESKMPGAFLQQQAARLTPDTILLSDDIMIHAVNWFYKRTDVYMTGAGESKHGLSFADAKGVLIEGEALKRFIEQNSGRNPIAVIHHSDAYDNMVAIMPQDSQLQRWGKFVMWVIPAASAEE
jgi:4-amino-4-deoxy-L-arabinose transferase